MTGQNNSSAAKHTESRSPATTQRHLINIAVLIGVTLLLFLPVLLHAHWGTFDDPSLILQSCRRLIDKPETINYILAAQMRMGIFYWVTLIWRLFPENPTGYFAVNFSLISSALCMLYAICFRLTRNASVSLLSTALVLTSPSLFEVIYTLDKQEVYFPFLFTAVILLHLMAIKASPAKLVALAAASMICATGAYLSKETSVILCLVSATLLATNLMFKRDESVKAARRLSVMFVATAAPLLFLKFAIFPTISDKYVVMTFDAIKLLNKTWQYALVVPDFFLTLGFTTCGAIYLLANRTFAKRNEFFCGFLTLLLASLASTAALISFDTFSGVLVYIWLPIYFLLAPCLAFCLNNLPKASPAARKTSTAFAIVLIALLFSQIPTRFLQAQFQFSFDALSSELAQKLSELTRASSTPVICAMPTYSVGETEIPEQIETKVRSSLLPRYYETQTENTSGQQFTMLNYLSPDCDNALAPGDQPGTFKLANFRGKSLSFKNQCNADYVGWTGFQILNGATPFQEWVRRPFGENALLIVPYGEVTPDTVLYRGAGIFAHPWQMKTLNFPQFSLEDVGHVERKLTNLLGHRQTMGWRILKIVDAQPVALNTSTDGWLKGDAKVFYRHEEEEPYLNLISKQQTPQALLLKQTDAQDEVIIPRALKEGFIIALPLKSKGSKGTLTVEALDGGGRIHVDKADYVKDAQPVVFPHLSLTEDGWLLNNALIVYKSTQEGGVITIRTKQPHAEITVSGERTKYPLEFLDQAARVTLKDGKLLKNGFKFLKLTSEKPLVLNQDSRPLLIHVDGLETSLNGQTSASSR